MAKIVVKIKDGYLLSKNFYNGYQPFILIGDHYFESVEKLQNSGLINSNPEDFNGVIGIVKQYGLQLKNCFYLIDNMQVAELVLKAYKANGFKTQNLLNFFLLEVSDEILEIISTKFSENPLVEYVYERAELANFLTAENLHISNPENASEYPDVYPYIHELFKNFEADHIEQSNQNINVVVIDQAWDLTQVRRNPGFCLIEQLGTGFNFPGTARGHGTNTLNILTGKKDTRDHFLDGLCTQASHYISSSWYFDDKKSIKVEQRESCLVEVFNSDRITEGDIVLLELQISINQHLYPIEVEPLIFNLISLGSAIGLNIIEPAGNGKQNLNDEIQSPLRSYLQLSDTIFSGAIMVGAVRENFSLQNDSNYGDRIDCYAYGDPVWTQNRISYAGTSLASAILTGLAANLQTLAKTNGKLIGPDAMKTILRCVVAGIVQVPNSYGVPAPAEFKSFMSRSS